jgi:hypothetical protein
VAANAAPASRTRHISAESRCDFIASLLRTEPWEGADFARGDEQRGSVLEPILCSRTVSIEQRMQCRTFAAESFARGRGNTLTRSMWPLNEESEPYGISAEDDLNAGKHILTITLDDPPFAVALIAGDFVYCLRSSLDHLAWQRDVIEVNNLPPWCSR